MRPVRSERLRNVPALCASNVMQFVVSKSICVIQRLPFSPDLAPADFFLFLKANLTLKGKRFSEISDIQRDVIELLKGCPVHGLQRAFEDLY